MNTSPAFLTYGAYHKWLNERPSGHNFSVSAITHWLSDDFLDNMQGKGTNKITGTLQGATVTLAVSNLVEFKQRKPSQISPKEYKTLKFHIKHSAFSLTLTFKASAKDMRPWLNPDTPCTYDFTGSDVDFVQWLTLAKLQGHEMFSKVDAGVVAGAAVYQSKQA